MRSFLAVLTFFLDNPHEEVYLRELARKLALSASATRSHCDLLLDEGLIIERRSGNMRFFRSNADDIVFRHFKKAYGLRRLARAGMIKHLLGSMPRLSAIILYGSLAKGQDTKDSDIDLLLIGSGKLPDLSRFRLPVEPHLFSWPDWKRQAKENPAYYEDIILHGIPLHGELPVVP